MNYRSLLWWRMSFNFFSPYWNGATRVFGCRARRARHPGDLVVLTDMHDSFEDVMSVLPDLSSAFLIYDFGAHYFLTFLLQLDRKINHYFECMMPYSVPGLSSKQEGAVSSVFNGFVVTSTFVISVFVLGTFWSSPSSDMCHPWLLYTCLVQSCDPHFSGHLNGTHIYQFFNRRENNSTLSILYLFCSVNYLYVRVLYLCSFWFHRVVAFVRLSFETNIGRLGRIPFHISSVCPACSLTIPCDVTVSM